MKATLFVFLLMALSAVPASSQITGDTVAMAAVDTTQAAPPQDFIDQTANGTRVVSEEGLAAFFPSTLRGRSIANAFHNTAPRGSIIEVTNLNNGRRAYVKVIGTIPVTRTYHNCIIGISAGARKVLDVRDGRTRCALRFAGY